MKGWGVSAGARRVGLSAVIGAMVLGSALGAAAPARAEMVINLGNGADPETLDPYRITSVTANTLVRDLCEGLVAYDPAANIIPGLAESWTVSEDGLTWTFTLRPDLKFGDGSPLTAEDFVWSWRRSVDPKSRPGFPELMDPIRNAKEIVRGQMPPESLGVAAPDPRTLVVTLWRPFPEFLGYTAVSRHAVPLQRTAIEKHGDNFVRPGNFWCSGAFNLAEAVPQSHFKLVRNPHYWDVANVKPDTVFYRSIEDVNTELKLFRAGELHATNSVPNQQIPWARENLAESLRITDYAGTYYYLPNLTREPWKSNAKLRMALAMAVDRETLTSKVLNAGQKPAYTLVPPGLDGYEQPLPEWASWTQEQRNAKARELLKEAGYGPQNPLRFEILYNTHDGHRLIAVALAAMWKQNLGVEPVLNNQEWKVVLERQSAKTFPDLLRAGWIAGYAFAHLDLARSTASDAGYAYNDPAFDALMAESDRIADPDAYRAKLREAEIQLMTGMPIIPLYHYTRVRLVDPRMRGWEANIIDSHPAKYLWIEK